MLTKIHHSYRGPENCLRFARDAIFWPSVSKDIEEFCHSCPTCAQYGKQAATEPMLSHSNTSVAIRLPGQIYVQPQTVFNHSGSLQWLLRVGQTSRYPINHCHQSYKSPFLHAKASLYTALQTTVQFVSHEYKQFAQTFGFEHITSSPYWSRSNGKAEAAVSDAKSILKSLQTSTWCSLTSETFHPRGHSFSPVQRLMDRHTRSTLPLSEKLLQPTIIIADPPTVSSEINHRKIASKAHYNKHSQAPLKPLPLGSYVYTKPRPSQQGNPWIYSQIIDSTAPAPTTSIWAISYSAATGPNCVQPLHPNTLPRNLWTFHWCSIPLILAPPESQPTQQLPAVTLQIERPITPPSTQSQQQDSQTSETPAVHDHQQATRSARAIRPPQKFKDFVAS